MRHYRFWVSRPVLCLSAVLAVWMADQSATQTQANDFVAPGLHRVEVSLVDADTGEPVAARIQFQDEDGAYYPPLGYPRKIPNRQGASLSLPDGNRFAYVNGSCSVEVPGGVIQVKAEHGPEYEVHESRFEASSLAGGKLEVPLKRWSNVEADGWIPADTHFHFPDPATAVLEMKAEDLRITNLLVAKVGTGDGERAGEGTFWNAEHFRGAVSPLSDPRHLLYTNEEFRNHFLGHLIFLNLKRLVWPVSTGGPPENGWRGYDLPTHADAAEEARRQGGLVIWAHFPYPNGENPVDVALGKIDAFDLLTTGDPFELHPTLRRIYQMFGPGIYELSPLEIYYAYLNCGFRITATAGSDKMGSAVPMGSARVYAKTGGEVSYAAWIEAIRRGETFISTAPLIDLEVSGAGPGQSVELEKAGASLRLRASSRSRLPYQKLEIVHNGEVVASAEPSGGHWEAAIDTQVSIDRSGWIAARCWGREMLPYGGPPGHWFRMPVFAHTSPVYIEVDGLPVEPGKAPELFLDQIEDHRKYVLYKGNYPSEQARQRVLAQIEEAEAVYRQLDGQP